jgi:hypothetical protein
MTQPRDDQDDRSKNTGPTAPNPTQDRRIPESIEHGSRDGRRSTNDEPGREPTMPDDSSALRIEI